MPLERTETVTVRMSTAEREMLARLAEADGLSASDILRLLLRREHSERFPSKEELGRERRRITQKARQAKERG